MRNLQQVKPMVYTSFIIESKEKSNSALLKGKKHRSRRRDMLEMNSEKSNDKPIVLNVGRWTEEEHEVFLKCISLYGNSWRLIAKHIKTRSTKQIRSHCQKYFEEQVKKMKKDIKRKKEKTLFVVYRAYRNYSSCHPLTLDSEFKLSNHSLEKIPSLNQKIEELESSKDDNIKGSDDSEKFSIISCGPYLSREDSDGSYQILENLTSKKEEFDHEIDIGLQLSSNFEFLDDAFESPRLCEKRNVFSEIVYENDNYSIQSNICLNDLY